MREDVRCCMAAANQSPARGIGWLAGWLRVQRNNNNNSHSVYMCKIESDKSTRIMK